jgi:peptide chain release factor subunit 1
MKGIGVNLTTELHELATFSIPDLPVVSVYLDTQWRDQHQHERVATFIRTHLSQAGLLAFDSEAAHQSLGEDLERIAQWNARLLSGESERHASGVALFACGGAGLWMEVPSPLPFENEFIIADRPALRQLARLDDDYGTTLVVLVDSRAARICEVVFGGLQSETDMTGNVPGRHKQGGWSQMRYQRHIKDRMDHHHKEVADYLAAYIVARPDTSVILCGQAEIVANLRSFLPPLTQQQIIDELQLDMRTPQAEIVAVAQEVIERHEREAEQEHVQQLINCAGRGGLAALGLQETIAAANTGRIHMLVMDRDLSGQGWRCQVCDAIGEDQPQACSVCGGQIAPVALGEALVSQALKTDAAVDLIEPDERLAAYEGVGVLLRYK